MESKKKSLSKTDIDKMRLEHQKEMKNQRNKSYYEQKRKVNKVMCESCCCSVDKYQFEKHLESNKHKKILKLIKDAQEKDE